MNQILTIENKNKKNKSRGSTGPIEIKSIVRFFAIAIIVFALCIISHSSYAIYRESRGHNTDDLASISLSRVNDTLIVNVQSQNIIDKFKYHWNGATETSIEIGSNNTTQEITLPSENDILTIVLEDETGRAVTYTKEIILSGVDIVKPTIELEKGQGNSVIITARDETQIDYMTYKIDDGEEIRIDKNNEEDTSIEYAVTDIQRGEHTIFVTAVDSSGNIENNQESVIVSSDRPTINSLSIDRDPDKIIIDVSDVDGIQSIEVNLNGAVYRMDNVNRKQAKFSLDLVDGTNTISIVVTNINGISESGATEFNYAR